MVINSLKFLNTNLFLNIVNVDLKDSVSKIVSNNFNKSELTYNNSYYYIDYLFNLNKTKSNYVLHFEEDHLFVCNNLEYIEKILIICEKYKVDLIKSTFNEIENISYKDIIPIFEDDNCKVICMDKCNQEKVAKSFGGRYFIGVNCIFERKFAFKFWSRKIKSYRPHPFEFQYYNKQFQHILMIPKKEIMCVIDDDHGLPGSCYLSRVR